jgi:hypothetical protein
VRSARLWAGLLGLVRVVAEGVEFDEAEQGHDAWVVGDDDVVLVDWYGATDYAQSKPPPLIDLSSQEPLRPLPGVSLAWGLSALACKHAVAGPRLHDGLGVVGRNGLYGGNEYDGAGEYGDGVT